ncbi:FAD-dependent oxidoreductase [Rhodoferax sp. GW822-FHT02A01]|uniref:NAD(P)/FAD-dependent oxidoreductase n=1 Tax=Rhodoferax sp. GW822-FHT02A01 TaxID=3141537 RepID=UPI00315DBCF6
MNPAATLVIGAGPAGSACALWLHQLGCPVTLLERCAQAGGLQTFSPYENRWLPSLMDATGQEIAARLDAQLRFAGVDLRTGVGVRAISPNATGFAVELEDGGILQAPQVVLATGARFRSGGFHNAGAVAIGPGHNTEALEVQGKRVAFLGGGDNAFDQYGFIMRRGAQSVTLFARAVRAQHVLRAAVPASDVVVGPFEVRQRDMTVNGQVFDAISVQFGFEAVVPEGLQALQRTPLGFVAANLWGETSVPHLYAAGEISQTFHPCVATSFAHGIQVAKHIHRQHSY